MIRESSSRQFLPRSGIELVKGSLEDKGSLSEALKGVDWVFHLAGKIKGKNREEFFRVNCQGTKNLLEQAAALVPPLRAFVYLSSLSAAGPSRAGQALREEDQARPVSYYGQSKLAAEREAGRFADLFPVIIIRPAAVYGPREKEIFQIIRLIRRGIRFCPSRGDIRVSVVHISDLIRGMLLACRRLRAGVTTYFIADGREYSWQQSLRIIGDILRVKSFPVTIPRSLAEALTRISAILLPGTPAALYLDKIEELRHKFWVCGIEKAQKELGFFPEFDLQTGMKDTIQWYRSQGWLP